MQNEKNTGTNIIFLLEPPGQLGLRNEWHARGLTSPFFDLVPLENTNTTV